MLEKPKQANGIDCDTRVQFGAPCIAGTRITTDAVYSMYLGGESIAQISDCYGVHKDDVVQAVSLEEIWALDEPGPWYSLELLWSTIHDLWWRFRGWMGGCKC